MPTTDPATAQRRRILVVTPDTLGVLMAGPAIRAWEIAKALSAVGDVRLLSTNRVTDDLLQGDRFQVTAGRFAFLHHDLVNRPTRVGLDYLIHIYEWQMKITRKYFPNC